MNIELLKKCGEAAFGSQWQTDLSKELAVSARSIRYWVGGEKEIPKIAKDLVSVINNRQAELEKAKKLLRPDSYSSGVTITVDGVEFYTTEKAAMSWFLRRSSRVLHKNKGKFITPYFCVIEQNQRDVDGVTYTQYFYAIKFFEKLDTAAEREFKSEEFNVNPYWTPLEFDHSQSGVLKN